MTSAPLSPFAVWQNFYVIVGSAAGALTGLQFVVITLITQMRAAGNMRDLRAFGSPTVVHFCSALLIAALMVMPWPSVLTAAGCLFACGVAGALYSTRVIWHARQAAYSPDFEDWLWYTAFPVLAHLTLVAAAILLRWNTTWSLFLVAGDCLALLTLGIHNAWDTVTYIAVKHSNASSAAKNDTPSPVQ